ncbi:MAG: hypothetical protein RLZZ366_1211 [Pseudomonadota bacterium]
MPAAWSLVLAYYNEAAYLPATLKALAAQDFRSFTLILIDNASTDGSAAIARDTMSKYTDVDVVYLEDKRPGQLNALETGLARVATEYVAICDADTIYPPHYLSTANRLLTHASDKFVAALAFGVGADPTERRSRIRRFIYAKIIARILRFQAHDGGFGYCFRTAALMKVGGYAPQHWQHVLADHELMNRVFRMGQAVYDPDFWCQPSDRRPDSPSTRWNLLERILYHATPFALKDWYFYRFLGPRFQQRKMSALNYRTDRNWEAGA